MRIILAGIIGRYPWGGVTWCSLMYLLGLRKLGHEVYYLEDTGECNYDPSINAIATRPDYALRYIDQSLRPFGFGESWCYVDYTGDHHGLEQKAFETLCKSADLFLVLSGGCWNWREHYLSIPTKTFVDSDPAFTQLAIDKAIPQAATDGGKRWYVDFFRHYDRLFTFGRNIGTKHCSIPTNGLTWLPTSQPIDTHFWQPALLPPRSFWTTVMTWEIESFRDIGGNKNEEFVRVLDLPREPRLDGTLKFELAVNGPQEMLRQHGWHCVDAFCVSSDLWRYHQYIASSRGEFSVAKRTYVETCSGWFSDRTECYLACGKPAVVQETGFSSWLPTGKGILSWTTAEQAMDGLLRVEADYGSHAKAAREVAKEYFDSDRILRDLLENL